MEATKSPIQKKTAKVCSLLSRGIERGENSTPKSFIFTCTDHSGDESGETVESGELGEELNPKCYIVTFGQLIVQPPAWDRYGFVWEAADNGIKQPTLYFRRV